MVDLSSSLCTRLPEGMALGMHGIWCNPPVLKHGWLENPWTEWRFPARKIIDQWSIFQPAMFDDTEGLHQISAAKMLARWPGRSAWTVPCQSHTITEPSGKRLQSELENHYFSWDNYWTSPFFMENYGKKDFGKPWKDPLIHHFQWQNSLFQL